MIYTTVRNEARGHKTKALVPEIPEGTDLGGLPLIDVTGKASTVPAQGRYLLSMLDTQCGPCKQQVDSLNSAAKGGGFSGVIAIFSEAPQRVRDFKEVIKPEFFFLIDAGRGPISLHRITTFPQTIELNNGKVVRSWVGFHEHFE
jgi:hypothetical protein